MFFHLKKRYWIIYFCGLILPIFAGCSKDISPAKPSYYQKPYKVLGKWYQPLPDAKGFKQREIASWYGKNTAPWGIERISGIENVLRIKTSLQICRNAANNSKGLGW